MTILEYLISELQFSPNCDKVVYQNVLKQTCTKVSAEQSVLAQYICSKRFNYDCFKYKENEFCPGDDLCGNDTFFKIPVIEGDFINFQFKSPMPLTLTYGWKDTDPDNWLFDMSVIEAGAGDTWNELTGINNFAYSFGIGWNNKKPYQWIRINPAEIDFKCFCFKFIQKTESGNKYWYSDWYEKIDCERVSTIAIQGKYCDLDMLGNYYGEFLNGTYLQDQNNFELFFRVKGEMFKKTWSLKQDLVKNRQNSNTLAPIYQVRTDKLPEHIVDKIAITLSCGLPYINGKPIRSFNNIDKNFEDGKQWMLDIECRGLEITQNFNCDTNCNDYITKLRDYENSGNAMTDLINDSTELTDKFTSLLKK